MAIQIIADSCCDATEGLRKKTGMESVPLTIHVDGRDYVDDDTLQVPVLLKALKQTKKPVKTAAPAPESYASLMRKADASVVVTLSDKLSGSYNAAMAAKDMVLEETPQKQIMVVNSKSASAGQVRLVLQLHEWIKKGLPFEEIGKIIPAFVSKMRTLFVLEDLTTLIKNGRIPKMLGMLASILMFRPIMGENGEGEIIQLERVRGTAKAMDRLVQTVAAQTEKLKENTLVLCLSYCNCLERAQKLKDDLLRACPAILEIVMQPVGGLSATYANDGGIVLAYA